MNHSQTHRSKRSLKVGAAGIAIGLALSALVLVPAEWDPSAVAAFGEEESSTLAYAEERLGQVAARESIGHDGRFFFVQANDPLLLEPDENAMILDRPTYRVQRMLYPLLAGFGGLASPEVTVWTLVVVNILAMGAGAAALANYAQLKGMSPWFGLGFPLNPGLMSELTIDGAGVVAFACVCGALVAVEKERTGWALVLLVLGALSREVMLVAAFGVALWMWMRGSRRRAWIYVGIPVLSVLAWGAYVRFRLPAAEAVDVQEIGPPLMGVLGAVGTWIAFPIHLAVGGAVVLCLILFASHLIRGRSDVLAYATLGFAALAVLLTQQVWEASFDMARAVAPVLSALIVNPLLFSRRSTLPTVRA